MCVCQGAAAAVANTNTPLFDLKVSAHMPLTLQHTCCAAIQPFRRHRSSHALPCLAEHLVLVHRTGRHCIINMLFGPSNAPISVAITHTQMGPTLTTTHSQMQQTHTVQALWAHECTHSIQTATYTATAWTSQATAVIATHTAPPTSTPLLRATQQPEGPTRQQLQTIQAPQNRRSRRSV